MFFNFPVQIVPNRYKSYHRLFSKNLHYKLKYNNLQKHIIFFYNDVLLIMLLEFTEPAELFINFWVKYAYI